MNKEKYTTQEKTPCPYPDCPHSFHVWEKEERFQHLKTAHFGFLIDQLRLAGLHAEASEIASTP